MEAPIIIKDIPPQITNEGAAFGPFNLADYIQATDASHPRFHAELNNGESLPRGLICTSDGILTGIAAKKTQGNYEIVVTAENEAGSVQIFFTFTINPSLAGGDVDYLDKLKSQVWEAIQQNLAIPEAATIFEQPITIVE